MDDCDPTRMVSSKEAIGISTEVRDGPTFATESSCRAVTEGALLFSTLTPLRRHASRPWISACQHVRAVPHPALAPLREDWSHRYVRRTYRLEPRHPKEGTFPLRPSSPRDRTQSRLRVSSREDGTIGTYCRGCR